MIKKEITYFIVGLLIISSFAVISIGREVAVNNYQTLNITFSKPVETLVNMDGNTYVSLEVTEANSFISEGPMLPRYTTTIKLPFGTKILDVKYAIQGEVKTKKLNYEIMPAPVAISVPDLGGTVEYLEAEQVYVSGDLYPDSWFSYTTGGGLDENSEHTTFLTLEIYPVRYSQATDTMKYIEGNIVLTITKEEPASPIMFPEGDGMVIIAPQKFSSTLQKLVNHKNGKGILTTLKTTEEIYSQYSGVDKPEQIKKFIKDAIETDGVKYVLLVGGLKSIIYGLPRDDRNQGTRDYYVPVRYSNLYDYDPESKTLEDGYPSDLYYADIYNSTGGFDDWDSNNDGVFAEWHGIKKDKLDFLPDVYIGRLPCRSTNEVNVVVNKIINYENGVVGSWYDRIVCLGGDSFNDEGASIPKPHYPEGEVVCDYIVDNYMTEFTPVKLYAKNKDTAPSYTFAPENFLREVGKSNSGCGHLLLDGHGNPASWTSHWYFPSLGGPGGWGPSIIHYETFNFIKMRNNEKLPVCVVGGCHNNLFNVSILTTIWNIAGAYNLWTYGRPSPWCWSEWLVRQPSGGSIATIGNTGLGYGYVGHGDEGPACLERAGGYIEICFYKTFDEESNILGECWGGAITKYQQKWPGMKDLVDCKTMQEWILFGDPSLKIGGYGGGNGFETKIANAAAGMVATPGETITLQAQFYNGQSPYTYRWDFGDGTTGTGVSTTHSYSKPGTYWVKLTAADSIARASIYETVVEVEPLASTPDTPAGQTNVVAGQTYV